MIHDSSGGEYFFSFISHLSEFTCKDRDNYPNHQILLGKTDILLFHVFKLFNFIYSQKHLVFGKNI